MGSAGANYYRTSTWHCKVRIQIRLVTFKKICCIRKVYAAASALLASQKVPIKMTGVSLAKSLFVAEGQKAMDDLRVEDMEPRMKSQVSCSLSLE